MKKVMLFFLLAAATGACAQHTIINDPNAVLRNVTPFTAIEVSDGIDLYLSQGDGEAMAVSASTAAARDNINTGVENGVLKITIGNGGKMWVSGNRKTRAYVSFRSLASLKASNGSDVVISGSIKVDGLKIMLSGASDLKGKIEANKLELVQSGASDAQLTGKVNELLVHASGASNLQAYGLKSEVCTVNASGASDVKVTVIKELTANANGASSVKYHGKPVVHSRKTSPGVRMEQ